MPAPFRLAVLALLLAGCDGTPCGEATPCDSLALVRVARPAGALFPSGDYLVDISTSAAEARCSFSVDLDAPVPLRDATCSGDVPLQSSVTEASAVYGFPPSLQGDVTVRVSRDGETLAEETRPLAYAETSALPVGCDGATCQRARVELEVD